MSKKPHSGYEKKKKKKKPKIHYIGNLLVSNPKKVSINEKIVKFLIYIGLRLVIRPRKWKDPKKNYEIIDRTYKRIMSADFIFIPSSIAFYLIMSFMPILSMILFLYQLPSINQLFISKSDGSDILKDILGSFIPGLRGILDQLKDITHSNDNINAGAFTATIFSLVVSTWIASGGFSKLVFTQSYLYNHKFKGGYWMNKIKGMFMVVIFSFSLFIALVINVVITELIKNSQIDSSLKNILKNLWLVCALFLGIFIAFIALFKLSPRFSIKTRNIIPGAMVSTIPTAGFLSIFGLISSLWSYGNYGVLGIIMYLGMASLIVTYFIFVGLSTNVAYYRTFVGDKVRNKWTFSKK